ncbi:caspase family protein [Tardiphaga sp.]|uniref:caspase family protein n=1 Tax=unclassified Tardiphaga TaxID=2631404 RepID=UPI00342BFAF4
MTRSTSSIGGCPQVYAVSYFRIVAIAGPCSRACSIWRRWHRDGWAILPRPALHRPNTSSCRRPSQAAPIRTIAFYDDLQRTGAASSSEASDILATVRLISGCQDNQYSLDGTFNSAFTEKLLRVWNRGKFDGDYGAFHRAVQKELPPSQSPNHTVIGKEMLEFDRQRPFKI